MIVNKQNNSHLQTTLPTNTVEEKYQRTEFFCEKRRTVHEYHYMQELIIAVTKCCLKWILLLTRLRQFQ